MFNQFQPCANRKGHPVGVAQRAQISFGQTRHHGGITLRVKGQGQIDRTTRKQRARLGQTQPRIMGCGAKTGL